MKKFVVLFLLIFSCFQSIAQNLSIGDMQTIYNLPNWDAVDVYLIKKGWQFDGSKKLENGSSMIIWAYKKNTNGGALGWINLTLTGSKFDMIKYELTDVTKYNSEKSTVSNFGYKFVKTIIDNDNLSSLYLNTNFYLTFEMHKESETYGDNVVFHTIYMLRIPKEKTTVMNSPPLPTDTNEQNGVIKDIDGNSYKTVKIGDQVWMAENLNVTKYNDGTSIPIVSDPTIWSNLSTPAICWYDNDKSKYTLNKYGALYNFYTVNTDYLCPIGWRVPSDDDLEVLYYFLGGQNVAGLKIKSVTGWSSNDYGTNSSGFSGLPAGYRDFGGDRAGKFSEIKNEANWWSSTEHPHVGKYFGLNCKDNLLNNYHGFKGEGHSVRCIKN